ncbi:hypothetical protein V2J09_004177 [Rumex salicifolius]
MALDLTIVTDEGLLAITDESSEIEKSRSEAWMLNLSFMRMTMAQNVKPSMPKIENAREFMQKINEGSQSELADKSIRGSLMSELTTKKLDLKVNDLGNGSHERFLVQFIMNSLLFEFSQFQAMFVQNEGRLKKMKDQVAHLLGLGSVGSNKEKPSKKDKKKDKAFIKGPESPIRKKAWFDKKDTHYVFICFESNLTEVPNNNWWIDSGLTTHELKSTCSWGGMKAQIKGIGTYRLILDTGCHIDLEECLYVLECARNLVSLSRLDTLGYNVKFGHGGFSLYRHDYFYSSGTSLDSFYRFNLDAKFSESLFNIESQGIKRSASNKSFSFLWNQRLGHISKERMMRLVKNEILPQLDFSDLDVCRFH